MQNAAVEGWGCLPQNWNQAIHTERIFIAFSRGTSINVALASHTRAQSHVKLMQVQLLKNM